MAEACFIKALDVLFPRGNKLFGEAGQHGEAQMPPWPSVVAGAIRSRMLADAGCDMQAFANNEALADPALHKALGTPDAPGDFRIGWFSLARRVGDVVEPLFPLPADLYAAERDDRIVYLSPQVLPARLKGSVATEQVAVLRQRKAEKPLTGLWLTLVGMKAYLRGEPLSRQAHTAKTGDLWKTDPRIGIALDPDKRSAAEGRLYTTEGIALGKITPRNGSFARDEIGFAVLVIGADGSVPKQGMVRFGGDGRGARIDKISLALPEPDWERIAREKRFRIILATPAILQYGWRVPRILLSGVEARLTAAAVPRAQVVSGWDLARRKPKAALRAAPAGSVYWFEAPQADGAALMTALRKLVEEGLGSLFTYPDKARLAEGFNNVLVGNWAKD
jgi:CRISPR-associated protein Cmr3